MSSIAQEFQLTQIALVGARISAFEPYGFHNRNDLAMRRIVPDITANSTCSPASAAGRAALARQLPIWVHNIITDRDFPGRAELLFPLRRFEGELCDNKNNEVVSAVLSAGFKSFQLDPLHLPANMPLRQRCVFVTHIDIWQQAYRSLEHDLVQLLADNITAVMQWVEFAHQPGHEEIDFEA